MQSEVGAQRSLSHAEKQVPSYKTSSLSCIVIVAAVSFLGVVCAFQTIAPEPYMVRSPRIVFGSNKAFDTVLTIDSSLLMGIRLQRPSMLHSRVGTLGSTRLSVQ